MDFYGGMRMPLPYCEGKWRLVRGCEVNVSVALPRLVWGLLIFPMVFFKN